MSRVSNSVITWLNFLTILIAFSLIGFTLWVNVTSGSPCQRALKIPILVVGGVLLVVSLAGLVASCCRTSLHLFGIYLFFLFLLVLIFSFGSMLVFGIVLTNKIDADGLAIEDEKFGELPRRLQRYVINEVIWEEIKSCWAGDKLCGAIQTGEPLDFYLHRLPPILSGCCKPPNYCEFQFQNATYWTKPKSSPKVPEPDCKKWSNVQTELCFDCESCKAAILCNVKSEWAMLAMMIIICCLIIVITVNCISCCAFRNNRHDAHDYRKQKQF